MNFNRGLISAIGYAMGSAMGLALAAPTDGTRDRT